MTPASELRAFKTLGLTRCDGPRSPRLVLPSNTRRTLSLTRWSALPMTSNASRIARSLSTAVGFVTSPASPPLIPPCGRTCFCPTKRQRLRSWPLHGRAFCPAAGHPRGRRPFVRLLHPDPRDPTGDHPGGADTGEANFGRTACSLIRGWPKGIGPMAIRPPAKLSGRSGLSGLPEDAEGRARFPMWSPGFRTSTATATMAHQFLAFTAISPGHASASTSTPRGPQIQLPPGP